MEYGPSFPHGRRSSRPRASYSASPLYLGGRSPRPVQNACLESPTRRREMEREEGRGGAGGRERGRGRGIREKGGGRERHRAPGGRESDCTFRKTQVRRCARLGVDESSEGMHGDSVKTEAKHGEARAPISFPVSGSAESEPTTSGAALDGPWALSPEPVVSDRRAPRRRPTLGPRSASPQKRKK